MTRKSIIGGIRAAALSGAFFLALGAVPLFGLIAAMLSPAPILIFSAGRSRANLRACFTVLMAALLVMGLTAIAGGHSTGFRAAGEYLITAGVATIVMTWAIERRQPFEAVLIAAAGTVFALIAVLAVVAAGGPSALMTALQNSLAKLIAQGQETYRALGMPNPMSPEVQSDTLDLLVKLSPGLTFIFVSLSILLNLRVFWRWAGKQRLQYPLFADLVRWSAPEWLIWGLIATGFGMLAPIAPLSDIATNAFLCFAFVYFCQGLAIMAFYFQALSVPAIVRGVIYFITIVQLVVALVVCLAGVFDMWIDFRRLKPPSQEAGNYGDFL
jgi:uncharacterized protein YybS (DUF2232 family)